MGNEMEAGIMADQKGNVSRSRKKTRKLQDYFWGVMNEFSFESPAPGLPCDTLGLSCLSLYGFWFRMLVV